MNKNDMDVQVNETLWIQKYRPSKFSDIILPEQICSEIQGYLDKKDIPNLIFYGNAGIGKTTTALAIIKELNYEYIEINGSLDNSIDDVRSKIVNFSSTVSLMNNSTKVVFVTEADGFSSEGQKSMKNVIEKYSKGVRFIFDTNHIDRINPAVISRCVSIDFDINEDDKIQMMKKILLRTSKILDNENITYDKKILAGIIKSDFPDIRRIVNSLQKFSRGGELIQGEETSSSKFMNLIKALSSKNYTKIRNAVSDITNYDNCILKIFDSLDTYIKEQKMIPNAIIILGKYGYQNNFCVSKEINMLSLCTELLQEGIEFKI